jgi:hypothetical protein
MAIPHLRPANQDWWVSDGIAADPWEVKSVDAINVSKPSEPEPPEPIAIRKLDRIETTLPSSNPSG